MRRRTTTFFATVGRDDAVSLPANAVLDTGPGPILIDRNRIDPAWHSYICLGRIRRPLDAFESVTKFCGFVHLTHPYRRSSGRGTNSRRIEPRCTLLPETSFTGQHEDAILPELRNIACYQFPSIAISGQRSLNKPKTSLSPEFEGRFRKFWTTRKLTILPMLEGSLQARCSTAGLCTVQNISRLPTRHLILTANGTKDIFSQTI